MVSFYTAVRRLKYANGIASNVGPIQTTLWRSEVYLAASWEWLDDSRLYDLSGSISGISEWWEGYNEGCMQWFPVYDWKDFGPRNPLRCIPNLFRIEFRLTLTWQNTGMDAVFIDLLFMFPLCLERFYKMQIRLYVQVALGVRRLNNSNWLI